MNSKRSYLDTLNAGRQRRVHTSIEELNRTLETLEQRIDRPARVPERNAYATSTRPASRWDSNAYPPRDETARPRRSAEPSYQTLVRDIERVRDHEDGLAAAGKIAGELKGLREELRHQMTAGLKREFDALRQDIERAYTSSAAVRNGSELGVEFERLSDAIQSLAGRSDDKSTNLLRLELEQVKTALDTLAHDESARSSDLDRRWARMEDRSHTPDPAIAALHGRLEDINRAVNNLPESLSLRSLEEKVRTLAGAVDHFARQQEGVSAGSFAQIEERLDEISRAIVASAVSVTQPNFDPQPFERIEARISSLARQIEELIEDRPGGEVIDRLNMLSQRVDEIALRGQLPEKAMEKLAGQVALIADRLDSAPAVMPDTDQVLRGIEERFDVLSDLLDRRQGDAIEHGQALFRDLERRLDQLATRLDERQPAMTDTAGIMDAIDQRFVELTRKLESRGPAGGAAISTLEARLDDISAQLEASTMKVASIDPKLIRSLEAQVAGLSAHLSKPNQPLPDFDDIGPRLDDIERSIAGSRETILEAARHAAENAVRALGSNGIEGAAAAGLAQDLKALDQLSRNSDERNTKTFEAIHETLLKIVERLARLEEDRSGRYARMEPEQPRKQTLEHAPSIEPGIEAPLAGDQDFGKAEQEFSARRTPAEAAAAAAVAAMDAEPTVVPEKSRGARSLFGGLTRAFSKKEKVEPTLSVEAPVVEVDTPVADLDAPLDPKIANRPLEPGSGAPDLSAIMRRVRDERGQPVRQGDTDTAKSDFIAAARRAAQAAAAEAEIAKRGSSGSGAGKVSSLGGLFNIRRKPVLMAAAAILIALAALQLGKAFVGGGKQQVAGTTSAPAVIEEPIGAETATMMDPAPSDEISSEQPDEIAGDAAGAFSEPEIVEDTTEPVPSLDAPAPAEADPRPVRQAEPATTATVEPTPGAPAINEDSTTATTLTEKVVSAPAAAPAESIPEEAGPLPLREAAAQSDAKALFEIGSRYAEGRGVKQDMAAAAKWYEKAADLGLAPAQYRIGNFYEKGLGVERDVAKAKTWYQMAAEQGNASAMHNLAVLFAMGADGTTDNESAARWFIEAADFGVKDSQFNLGILSAKGVGMPQNLEESYKWFALVAKAGDKDAASKRDEIANALRPEQLTKARAAAELWKAKPVKAEANTVDLPDAWLDSKDLTTASVDMRQAVRNIQLILNKNGYDAGTADGLMGDKTKSAIAEFQKANGMNPTGEVDEPLVKALLEKK
ncbi:MAG TPA: peptidoglycan-binding protein [Rhizobiaceae bacterium]|nr:peptidoglycan-binding protein [Rhizobiaceae bacterium]